MSYAQIAKESRLKVLDMVYKAQTSHIGSLLGCADIIAVLFEKIDFEKDKLVLGKSWAAALVYYHLWRKGKITEEQLNSYCIGDSPFIGLFEPIAGIDLLPFGIGSMGMGFPVAVGIALSKKLKKEGGVVYCLMSDGELQVGTTWEAALIAGRPELNNLVVIVDKNGLQAMGRTENILGAAGGLGYEPSFPTTYGSCDFCWGSGHDFQRMEKLLSLPSTRSALVLELATVKGRGVSFMENNNLYHYKQLSEEEYEEAKKELENAI